MFIQYYYFDNYNLKFSTINKVNGIFMVIMSGKDMFSSIMLSLKLCPSDRCNYTIDDRRDCAQACNGALFPFFALDAVFIGRTHFCATTL